jgi:hypothetical protein
MRLRISAGALALALAILTSSAGAEVVQEGNLRVSFEGGLAPQALPRAGCPAPSKFTAVSFPFARASFGFEDGRTLTSTLIRTCRVKRTP